MIKLFFILTVLMSLTGCTYLNRFIYKPDSTKVAEHSEIIVLEEERYNGYSYLDLVEILRAKDRQIDSLYFTLEYYFHKNDSLSHQIEEFNRRVTINPDFSIPRSFEFAGREFDLSNERIFFKFEEIFNQELRNAHVFIPRSGIYFPVFDSIFAEYDIPDDVKYLAIAESGLYSMATSHVGAVGIWQFMRSTALGYGLKIDNFIDERREIFKATRAAARYLENSYSYLQQRGAEDWLLAMCAYNAGNAGVARVIREQQAYDFFDLIMRVDETNRYVWRAVAIKMIFEFEEELFGKKFERDPSLYEQVRKEKVVLKGHHKIDDWAVAQGTNLRRIWELNPWINIHQSARRRYSPINNMVLPPGEYTVLLPAESEKNPENVAMINSTFLDENAGFFTHHTVQRGDTLYGIARRYGTTISNIRALNNLRSDVIRPGQRLQLQGNPGTVTTSQPASGSRVYVVRQNDTVDGIARRLNVPAGTIISRNNLQTRVVNGNRVVMIYPGQRLYY